MLVRKNGRFVTDTTPHSFLLDYRGELQHVKMCRYDHAEFITVVNMNQTPQTRRVGGLGRVRECLVMSQLVMSQLVVSQPESR